MKERIWGKGENRGRKRKTELRAERKQQNSD